jgi:hypothetical protein
VLRNDTGYDLNLILDYEKISGVDSYHFKI